MILAKFYIPSWSIFSTVANFTSAYDTCICIIVLLKLRMKLYCVWNCIIKTP